MRNAAKIFWILLMISNTLAGQTFFERYEYSSQLLPLINTGKSEFSPAFVKNKLLFTSVNQEASDAAFFNVFTTETDNKGYPLILGRLVPGFGNQYHEGPVSWCEVTDELFVTLSNIPGNKSPRSVIKKQDINLGIAIMKEVDEKWYIVEELPFNRPEYNIAHPAISRTGDTLIFSSDMEGGMGSSDLYRVVRKDGIWDDPVNLGKNINTPGNEVFPTFGPDGLLFYSSDGFPDNLGKLDIYYTKLADDANPLNLGPDINSADDDFGLVLNIKGGYGYFSSDRPGKGSDDIYRVELIPVYETISGTVLNSSGIPVPDAVVNLQDCNGKDVNSVRSDKNGKFSFEVRKQKCHQAIASKSGYLSDARRFYLDKTVKLVITQLIRYGILVLDSQTGEAITGANVFCDEKQWITGLNGMAEIDNDSLGSCELTVSGDKYFNYLIANDPYRFTPGADIVDTVRLFKKDMNESYAIENIRFFLDKWRLLPGSEQELLTLIKLMKDNPSVKIELASHTDSRGEDSYNEWLSQKQAESAADFLIENGILKDRILPKGYGESRLLNHCANGVSCSEEEHLQNRRMEFRIIAF